MVVFTQQKHNGQPPQRAVGEVSNMSRVHVATSARFPGKGEGNLTEVLGLSLGAKWSKIWPLEVDLLLS